MVAPAVCSSLNEAGASAHPADARTSSTSLSAAAISSTFSSPRSGLMSMCTARPGRSNVRGPMCANSPEGPLVSAWGCRWLPWCVDQVSAAHSSRCGNRRSWGHASRDVATTCMGRDPMTPVLNGLSQAHEAPDRFCTDAAVVASDVRRNPAATFMAPSAGGACRRGHAQERQAPGRSRPHSGRLRLTASVAAREQRWSKPQVNDDGTNERHRGQQYPPP